MTTADIRILENEIERLVREHIAACKAAAEAAVERGFGSAWSVEGDGTRGAEEHEGFEASSPAECVTSGRRE